MRQLHFTLAEHVRMLATRRTDLLVARAQILLQVGDLPAATESLRMVDSHLDGAVKNLNQAIDELNCRQPQATT